MLDTQKNVLGFVGIIKDAEGAVWASMCNNTNISQKPVVAEAAALCNVMEWCREMGLS